MVLPLEADLHGEGKHHVDCVDAVNVQYVYPLGDDHRLVVLLVLSVGRRWVLKIGLWHDDLGKQNTLFLLRNLNLSTVCSTSTLQ